MRVETQRSEGRDEHAVALIVACINTMGHKPSQAWHNDAIITQKQYLNMSFYLNHGAKLRLFSDIGKLKKLKSFFNYEYNS